MAKEKIGIWGFGIVGKSVLRYIVSDNRAIQIMDKKELSQEEKTLLARYNAEYIDESRVVEFLEYNTHIIPSPGIDFAPYKKYTSKIIAELDLFAQAWKKPIIAITGTVGKTSIVHLFTRLLENSGKKVATGGNIGLAMLDLISKQNNYDLALLELSSFQLEYAKAFMPDIAVITNIFPNHLDRHHTIDQYIQAKTPIFLNQKAKQYTIIPWHLQNLLVPYVNIQKSTQSWIFFSEIIPEQHELVHLRPQDKFYYFTHDQLVKYVKGEATQVISRRNLPSISYPSNWLILGALADLCKLELVSLRIDNLELPEHRLELVAIHNNNYFYNDSKSTIPESTLQAVQNLNAHPVILLVGGVSKGVDRQNFIKDVQKNVKALIFFGAEAQQLSRFCDNKKNACNAYSTLEEAFQAATKVLQPGDQLLLSPAGASFDLFKNYQERGNRFKALVQDWIKKNP